MTNQFKNPIFWSVLAFIVGIVIAVWGHLKSESDNYSGSNTMIIVGLILFIGGTIGMFSFGNRKR